MKNKIIVTLISGFLLAFFTLFNRQQAGIYFFNIQLFKGPLASIVFWSFIAGVVYAAIIAALGSVKLRKTISRQKNIIEEYEIKNEK